MWIPWMSLESFLSAGDYIFGCHVPYRAVRRRVLQDCVFRTAGPPSHPFCINHEGRADRWTEGRRAATGMEGSNGRMRADGNWYIAACYCQNMTTVAPHSKHSVIQTSQLMLYSEIMAICSEIHTKHINTLCGQNVAVHIVTTGGTYSDHWRYI